MLKGKLTISKITSTHEDYVAITLLDGASGVETVSIKVPMEVYGQVIAGTGRQPVEFELGNRMEHVGKKKETKRVVLKAEHCIGDTHKRYFDKLKETDEYKELAEEGWEFSSEEFNVRNYDPNLHFYYTILRRYVEVTDNEAV